MKNELTNKELIRIELIKFLQRNDTNGSFTDEDAIRLELDPLTYEQTLLFLWFVLYQDLECYNYVQNALEISYDYAFEMLSNNKLINSELTLIDYSNIFIRKLMISGNKEKTYRELIDNFENDIYNLNIK